jgi:predicted anti-sigma-YlaC factor YlaD
MKCETIRDLILTDYSDGELFGVLLKKVEEHLDGCTSCRALSQQVREGIFVPFKNLPELKVNDLVWKRIKADLQTEPADQRLAVSAMDIFRNFIYSFKPAIVTLCLCFMVGAVVIATKKPTETATAQVTYLAYVMEDENTAGDDVSRGVEQYFL